MSELEIGKIVFADGRCSTEVEVKALKLMSKKKYVSLTFENKALNGQVKTLEDEIDRLRDDVDSSEGHNQAYADENARLVDEITRIKKHPFVYREEREAQLVKAKEGMIKALGYSRVDEAYVRETITETLKQLEVSPTPVDICPKCGAKMVVAGDTTKYYYCSCESEVLDGEG